MQQQGVWARIVVDWEAAQYAASDASFEDDEWDRRIVAARKQGRDIHSFTHDGADMAGLASWAEKRGLVQTDMGTILPTRP